MSSTPKELIDARQSLAAGHILEAYRTAQAFVLESEEGSERDEAVQIMSDAASIYITEEEN